MDGARAPRLANSTGQLICNTIYWDISQILATQLRPFGAAKHLW